MIGLSLLAALSGYPLCVAVEAADGSFPEVQCYDTQEVRAWAFCSDTPAVPPGGLFADFNAPLRFEGYKLIDGEYVPVISGRAHRKEVARNDNGVAYATALVVSSGELRDGMEPLDEFAESSCTFILVLN